MAALSISNLFQVKALLFISVFLGIRINPESRFLIGKSVETGMNCFAQNSFGHSMRLWFENHVFIRNTETQQRFFLLIPTLALN